MTTGAALSRHTTERLSRPEVSPVLEPSANEPVNIKTLADAERAHIIAPLRRTNWLIGGARGAAAQLGLPRTTLIARTQRFGISGGRLRSRSGLSARRLVHAVGDLPSRLTDNSVDGLQVMEAVSGDLEFRNTHASETAPEIIKIVMEQQGFRNAAMQKTA